MIVDARRRDLNVLTPKNPHRQLDSNPASDFNANVHSYIFAPSTTMD
jgi:hypothetical protein